MLFLQHLYSFLFEGIVGDIANYIGLVFTIIGFVWTIREVKKSREEVKQAKREVIRVREDIQRIDNVSDLSRAINIIEEITRLQRQNAWVSLPDRFLELNKIIISIKQTYPHLDVEQKTILQNALTHFQDIYIKIDKAVRIGNGPSDIQNINKVLFNQINTLTEMLVNLQGNIGGSFHE